MYLYYVMGGGMGHLARAAAFIYTQKIAEQNIIILTASDYACEILKGFRIELLPADLAQRPAELAAHIEEILQRYEISEIILDVFPSGIMGEWRQVSAPNCKFYLLARRLRWAEYVHLAGANIRFERVYILEELEGAQMVYLREWAASSQNLLLSYPPVKTINLAAHFGLSGEIWLVVHSGNAEEVAALYAYACDVARLEGAAANFVLITAADVSELRGDFRVLRHWAAYAFFGQAARIFTGGGFNLMQQTRAFAALHKALPFARRYDDQFWRISFWYASN